MADPLTIIGAAASVAGIVELLGKTVSTLHDLRSRWKEADFTFINLIAQLSALKAALSKLQEWMDTDLGESHHQLVMDLEASVTCCRILVRRMDSEVETLKQHGETGLDTNNKIKLLLKNGTLDELQKMVDRQTSALTLLLTVCNCTAVSEQKALLEKASTRKLLKRVKDDNSSLYVQRDSTSILSRCTDNLSKISQMFEFDRELFISKVYEKALRGSLKDTVNNLRRELQQPYVIVTTEEIERNKLIEQELRRHAKNLSSECKLLIMGNQDCAQAFIKRIKIAHADGFTYEEREEYRRIVLNNIMRVMEVMKWVLEHESIDLNDTSKIDAAILSQEFEKAQIREERMTLEAVSAIQGLWQDKAFKKMLLHHEIDLPDSASYLMDEIQRMARNDYLPTDADILSLGSVTPAKRGIQELKFALGSLSFRIFDVSSECSEVKKWIHQLENMTSIVFFVDLSQYDLVITEGSNENKITESIALFNAVVNSRWFLCPSVILLLCNVHRLRAKLSTEPLSNHFADYIGGNDADKAAKYFLERFKRVTPMYRKELYTDFCDLPDESSMPFIMSAVCDTIILHGWGGKVA